MGNKVSMTLTSEVPAEDLEEILETLKPVIKLMGRIEIHTQVLDES